MIIVFNAVRVRRTHVGEATLAAVWERKRERGREREKSVSTSMKGEKEYKEIQGNTREYKGTQTATYPRVPMKTV